MQIKLTVVVVVVVVVVVTDSIAVTVIDTQEANNAFGAR